jgi:hypothetical protein
LDSQWRLQCRQRSLRRFPGPCETGGQVFKFVWRLRWKMNVVCMSLTPFISFQSWFATYFPSYMSYRTANLQTLHLKYLLNKYPYWIF